MRKKGLMDLIAGEVGFLADFIPSHGFADISFEMIENLRRQVSPDASYQAASIGIVRALPRPCILLEARFALKKSEERNKAQLRLAIPVHSETHAVASRCSRNHEPSSAGPWHIPPKELEGARRVCNRYCLRKSAVQPEPRKISVGGARVRGLSFQTAQSEWRQDESETRS